MIVGQEKEPEVPARPPSANTGAALKTARWFT